LKVSQIKNNYKVFIRNRIDEHDDEAYTVREIINLCETYGYNDLTDTRVRDVLKKYAKYVKHDNMIFWGNAKAIAQIEGTK